MQRISTALLVVALVLGGAAFATASGQEGSEGEVVLDWPSIWVPPDSKSETIAALIERFNAENEGAIRVELEGIPDYDGYADKMNTQLASGSAPDLFIFSPNPTTFQYYDSDVLMDFTEELSGPWSENFVAGYIEASTHNGRTKTVPYEIGLTPIWYNSAHLATVGYDEFPKTIDEFWELAEALKAADVVPTSQMTGGGNAWTSMLWFSHIVGSLGGPEVWSRPLSDPVFEEAAAVLMRLYQDGNTTRDAVGGDAGVSGGHYMAGNTAVFLNGPWYIGRIRNDAPDTYAATKVAAAPQVGDYHGHQIGFMLSNLAAANTDDPRRRAAVVKWMQFMTDPENVRFVSESAGSMFSIKYELTAAADPLQRAFVQASSDASFVIPPLTVAFPVQVVDTFKQALAAMALGEDTPAEFVQMLIDANNR
jgi:raffinose/stachyose/melibiose transport system substrate-binding protein